MRFHWIKDHLRQKQFLIYWRPGSKTFEIITLNTVCQVIIDACNPPTYSKL